MKAGTKWDMTSLMERQQNSPQSMYLFILKKGKAPEAVKSARSHCFVKHAENATF